MDVRCGSWVRTTRKRIQLGSPLYCICFVQHPVSHSSPFPLYSGKARSPGRLSCSPCNQTKEGRIVPQHRKHMNGLRFAECYTSSSRSWNGLGMRTVVPFSFHPILNNFAGRCNLQLLNRHVCSKAVRTRPDKLSFDAAIGCVVRHSNRPDKHRLRGMDLWWRLQCLSRPIPI